MLTLWSAGQADFDHTRKSSYTGAHAILICFALDSPVSLKNVESKVFHLLGLLSILAVFVFVVLAAMFAFVQLVTNNIPYLVFFVVFSLFCLCHS